MKHINKIKSKSRKGDFAEYYAVTWMWDKGYEVFQNSGCSGPVDMIAIDKKGNHLFIDVKTAGTDMHNSKPRSKHPLNAKQRKLNVKLLLFNPDTRELRFVEQKK